MYKTLIGSVCLVILVVFIFLRSPRATLIPFVAVPVSLIGTFAAMYLFGYTLDNLSLMALTIATGFVVDDAIVVMENITRHLEAGMEPFAAAIAGRAGDRLHGLFHQHVADCRLHSHPHDGRHHRTPLPRIRGDAFHGHRHLDGHFADHHAMHVRARAQSAQGRREAQLGFTGPAKRAFNGMIWIYRRSLVWVLDNPGLMLIVLLLTIALNVLVIFRIPTGFSRSRTPA